MTNIPKYKAKVNNEIKPVFAIKRRSDWTYVLVWDEIQSTTYNIEDIELIDLSLPKQEDLHDLLWKAFTMLYNKDECREEDRLMRKQLEIRLENNSMNIDFSNQKQEDTKQIEKIQLTKDDDYWEDTHRKINELVDKVNSLIAKDKDE